MAMGATTQDTTHEQTPWQARSVAETSGVLATDAAVGLTHAEATARLARTGPNSIGAEEREPWWHEAIEALTEPLVLLLIAVGVLYAIFGELGDAITIFIVIAAVAAIEVVNEARAKRAVASLSTLTVPAATVIRNGQQTAVASADVVPGDLVILEAGNRVPADLRLVLATTLRIDESGLTGESVPVGKNAETVLSPETELGDRANLAFTGTLVTAGKGRGVVTATGSATTLGQITGLAQRARDPRTPLQLQLKQLAGWLVWLALGLSLLVPLIGVLVAGRPVREMILTGLTLAFATIPEELPILITIVLGLGAYRLAKRHAIVKRLQAAETLGSVSVIGTDKTGTLTENKMRVGRFAPTAGNADVARLIAIGVLASDAEVSEQGEQQAFTGDPTETALLAAAAEHGQSVTAIRTGAPVLAEYPFDDGRKRLSVVYERDGARVLAMKGSPETVLATCTQVATPEGIVPLDATRVAAMQERAEAMAAQGLRVLAFAEGSLPAGTSAKADAAAVERDLTFRGFVGLEDPPRPEVAGAIATLTAAHVRVVMITGDHPATARAIAERVGIDASRVVRGRDLDGIDERELGGIVASTSVFARITPEHKLHIVRALQAQGAVVAVTGDGVNDAPALREAAIGVAMGKGGTDSAREAADLVLADDNFATVTVAVEAGRRLYANLRKAVRYYLAAKVALITASLVAVLLRLPVPFDPVQIIIMELFMDLGASMTFVAEPAEGDVMAQPPRDPTRPFLDRAMQAGILAGGLSLAAAVLIAFLFAWHHEARPVGARTAAFAAWMIGHLVLAANMRSERQPLGRLGLFSNRPFLVWAGAALALLVVSLAFPFLQAREHVALIGTATWLVIVAAALVLPTWWEIWKWLRWGKAGAGERAGGHG